MEPVIADRPFPGIEDIKQDKGAAKSLQRYAQKLFAEVAVRIVAFAGDVIVVLILMLALNSVVFQHLNLASFARQLIWALVMAAYFVACWISPMRATPMQFLFRMRVVSDRGGTLSLQRAVIRSVVLVATWWMATLGLKYAIAAEWWFVLIGFFVFLYVPSINARRQSVHDLLAHSVVLNERALHSLDNERHMREYLADEALANNGSARLSIARMSLNAVALGLPLFALITVIDVRHQKSMVWRVGYALGETLETRQRAEAWRAATGAWPRTEAELGLPLRRNYPAGGYFEYQEDGTIHIQFEVLNELKNGTILLEPAVGDGAVTWDCRTAGEIRSGFLPSGCR